MLPESRVVRVQSLLPLLLLLEAAMAILAVLHWHSYCRWRGMREQVEPAASCCQAPRQSPLHPSSGSAAAAAAAAAAGLGCCCRCWQMPWPTRWLPRPVYSERPPASSLHLTAATAVLLHASTAGSSADHVHMLSSSSSISSSYPCIDEIPNTVSSTLLHLVGCSLGG